MYKIINTNSGELVGYTESPIWIRKHKNGCYVQTERKKAEGIAFNSTPYSIGGLDGLDIVVVVKSDAGNIFVDDATMQAADAVLEDAMCEMDALTEERLAAIEDALCEMDMG